MAESQAQPFQITVLEGPTANTPAANLSLIARALPYRGVAWETEQRGVTTWYPGNPVATQQLMGPTDKPLTITGWWKDIFLGNGSARKLCDTFDSLNRAGHAVRLTWGASPFSVGPLVRTGYLKTFKQTYDRPQDVAWEMVFELSGRDEPAVSPFTAAPLINPGNGFDGTQVKFEDVVAVNSAFASGFFVTLNGLPQVVEGALDDVQNTLLNGIDYLNDASAIVADNNEIPGNVAERVRGVAVAGARAIGNAINVYQSLDLLHLIPTGLPLAWLDFKNLIYGILQTSDSAAETALDLDAAVAKQQQPPLLAEIPMSPDIDLRDIATRYYGNPDLWYLIARENGLSESKMPDLPTGPSDRPVAAVSGSVTAATLRIPQQSAGIMGVSRPEC